MFNDSAGCLITGTEYTSKHRRFSLILQPADGTPEFKVSFTDVAAYRFNKSHFGIITSVSVSPLDELTGDWDQMLVADQSGLWPGRLPGSPTEAAAMASRLGLRGFTISLDSGERAWAISSDFVLLGRRQRA
ncbi:hypothetical protein [Lysobacter sp. cf310]|uniref:hypothetical protein n=1 Tax=Lysobacter sp. cf310 TaxID=1761790 RepID=UPI001113E260|nr:hypothetical protein [Lysobacter sp. cf310]